MLVPAVVGSLVLLAALVGLAWVVRRVRSESESRQEFLARDIGQLCRPQGRRRSPMANASAVTAVDP